MNQKIDWKDVTFGGDTFNSRMLKGLVYSAKSQTMGFEEGPLFYNDELITTDDVDWTGRRDAFGLLKYYFALFIEHEVFPIGTYTVEKFNAALSDYIANKEKYLEEVRLAEEEELRQQQIDEENASNLY